METKPWLALLPLLFSSVLVAGADESQSLPMIGSAVEDFTLRSHEGREWSLSDFADDQLVVVVFMGTECPLAKLYGPRLAEIHQRFADQGVAFIAINANTQDSMTELSAYAERYHVDFPLLKDVGNRVADAMGATRTPEVFLLDEQRAVRYHGRIDDQYAVGRSRDKVNRSDLAMAIEQLLEGAAVTVPSTEPVGCLIGRVKEVEPVGDVTYSQQISRIFNSRCVECHREGEIAPFPLSSYDDVIGWEDTIVEVIQDQRMPPWFANPNHGEFLNDARLSDEEKQLIYAWVENGMPEGDPAEMPEPPKFAEGWRIPEPDQVFYMRDEAFPVPAQGVVDYQYFVVDTNWDEDKYVNAAEARPDNTSVVHHILAYVIPPDGDRNAKQRKVIVGYAPGSTPLHLRDGMAIHVPAGSKLLFEMHYTPNGYAQQDRSYIGVRFIDKKDVTQLLKGRMAINTRLDIPARAEHHEVTAEFTIRRDEMLLSMTPHMHLRGKAFRYEAIYPDGEREVLLDVPGYDFNWQLKYILDEPKLLPEGTKILCTAAYDNSEKNLANPDPNRTVHWGDQSWEEMMIGFFNTVPASDFQPIRRSANVKIDPSGRWTWKRPTRGGLVDELLALELQDDVIAGVLKTEGREVLIRDALVDGDRLTFYVVSPETPDVTVDFEAKIEPNQLRGDAKFNIESIGKSFSFPWVARRAAQATAN